MKYTTREISAEEEVLLVKSGRDVQAEIDNKIDELVNQGRQAVRNEVADNYEKADPIKKAEFETLVADVKAVELAKLEVPTEEVIK